MFQKIINLSYSTSNQPLKFRTKYWVEINDDRRGMYGVGNQIKSKKTFQCYSHICVITAMYTYLLKEL